jgi:hypothetical protein
LGSESAQLPVASSELLKDLRLIQFFHGLLLDEVLYLGSGQAVSLASATQRHASTAGLTVYIGGTDLEVLLLHTVPGYFGLLAEIVVKRSADEPIATLAGAEAFPCRTDAIAAT